MTDFLQSTITILGIETKVTSNGKTMFKIKGSDNRSYQLWQVKQDGTETAAYQKLKAYPNMGVGKTINISYTDQQGDFNGKTITYHTIVNIFPAPQSKSSQVAQMGLAQAKEQANDEKWERLGFGKCKYGFLIEAYKMGKQLLQAEVEAEQWAEASMRKGTITNPEYIPADDDQSGDIDTSKIPF